MSFLARLGLALVKPRAALAVAGDREHPGRSGSDLLVAIVVVVLVTQLRVLVSGVWSIVAADPSYGVQLIVRSLTDALAILLGFLIVGTLLIWAASGPRRELGRASDLACVAVLPIVIIDLVGSVVVQTLDLEVTRTAMAVLSVLAYTWAGGLIALAIVEARSHAAVAPTSGLTIRAGQGVALIAAMGLVVQGIWIARHPDQLRPMIAGDVAPDFSLPRIGAKGELGERVSLSSLRGKVVVLDFWATWCNPCLKSLPRLQAFQAKHPEAVVLTINLDDAAEARAVFDEGNYTLGLVAGDHEVQARYNVGPIPHTVVIDAQGRVRHVHRGGKVDLEREISAL